jgi:hypothetical protein
MMADEKTNGELAYEQAREQDPSRVPWAELEQSIRDKWERVASGIPGVPIKMIVDRAVERN